MLLAQTGETYRWQQNLITSLHNRGHSLSILIQTTWANGQNARLIELLDRGLWEKDTAGGLGLGLNALDENAVEEGGESLEGLEGGGL